MSSNSSKQSTRWLFALSASVLGAMLPTAPVSAQAVLTACYVPASGTVYRIKVTNTPTKCLQPTHVEFSWTDGAEAAASLQNAVKKTDVAAGDVTGVFSNLTVGKLLGRTLATTPPTDGQMLVWNASASAWEPKTVAAGGGGGTSDHGALTGLADDDHAQYLLSNGVRQSSGFAVRSEFGDGLPVIDGTGTGSGFLWYGDKGALRAGVSGVNPWSAALIGRSSTSFGESNLASGEASVTIGLGSTATSFASVALGNNANATAANAVAIGRAAAASGEEAIALSRGTASGYSSLAWGDFGVATSAGALAFNGRATGASSMAFGYRSDTDGKTGSVVFAVAGGLNSSIRPATAGQFVISAPHIFLGHNADPVATLDRFIETGPGAYLTSGGVWTNVSDSTKKTAFRAVNGEQVLTKLATLPVYTWQYAAESDSVRHMGPTAQAFRKAFGLGDSERAISTVDIDGVAIAGVQALEQRTRASHARIATLERENAELAARLAQLEALVANMVGSSTRR